MNYGEREQKNWQGFDLQDDLQDVALLPYLLLELEVV
jgi:hypothetical protein